MSDINPTQLLLEQAAITKEAASLLARAGLLIETFTAIGVLQVNGQGAITGVDIDAGLFVGRLEGLDARHLLGVVKLFALIQAAKATPIDNVDARTVGEALLSYSTAA